MTILAAGYAASSSTGKIIDYLKSESDNNYIMKAQIINFILNAGINIILIPIYGITGAAIGTSISSVTFSLILMYRAKKTEDVIAWEPHLLKIIFSGLTSLIITYSILKTVFSTIPPLAVVPAGILYFILYIMIYAATGLKQEDWDMWYKILRKFGLLNYWKKWTRKLRLFEDR
jgi:O-antigen/teichoic acid export membrane protein